MQVDDRHTRRRQIRGRDAGARYMGAADGDNYQRNFLKLLAIVIDSRYVMRRRPADNFCEKILIFCRCGNPYKCVYTANNVPCDNIGLKSTVIYIPICTVYLTD